MVWISLATASPWLSVNLERSPAQRSTCLTALKQELLWSYFTSQYDWRSGVQAWDDVRVHVEGTCQIFLHWTLLPLLSCQVCQARFGDLWLFYRAQSMTVEFVGYVV